jgi:hypothetical protein
LIAEEVDTVYPERVIRDNAGEIQGFDTMNSCYSSARTVLERLGAMAEDIELVLALVRS